MWKCSKCKEECEDTFDSCWSCGTGRDGSPSAEPFPERSSIDVNEVLNGQESSMGSHSSASIKKFVVATGEVLLKVMVVLGCIGSIVVAYNMAKPTRYSDFELGTFLVISIAGILGTIMTSFVIFLLIDIRDELHNLRKER